MPRGRSDRSSPAPNSPELRILPDTAFRRGRAIRLVRAEDRAPFDYAVRVSRGDLLIDGGGSWAP